MRCRPAAADAAGNNELQFLHGQPETPEDHAVMIKSLPQNRTFFSKPIFQARFLPSAEPYGQQVAFFAKMNFGHRGSSTAFY